MRSIWNDIKNILLSNSGLNQIITINVIVFIVLILFRVVLVVSGNKDIYQWIGNQLMMPAHLPDFIFKPWTIITYFFVHEDFFHIIFNLLFLYWFGMIIRDFLGDRKIVALFILGGIAGGIFYLLIYNLIPYFHDRVTNSVLLGASAGVYAIVVGAATLAPDYQLMLLILGPVRIKWIALFYILLSVSGITGGNPGGNLAHLGGALIGFIYITQLRSGNDLGKPVFILLDGIKNFFLKKQDIKISHKNPNKPPVRSGKDAAPNQDEIDAILDKIAVKGYDGLTKEEKQKLFSASQKK